MAVVYLKHRNVTNEDEFKKFKKSSSSKIFTDGRYIYDFSIDITLGDRWNETVGLGKTQLYENSEPEFVIKPKSSVIIESQEKIKIPNNIYGVLMPTGKLLLYNGVICATSKIEPGFSDKLILLLFNTSEKTCYLKKGAPVASCIFFQTENTLDDVQESIREDFSIPAPKSKWIKTKKSIAKNFNENPFSFWSAVFTLLCAAITASAVFFQNKKEDNDHSRIQSQRTDTSVQYLRGK